MSNTSLEQRSPIWTWNAIRGSVKFQDGESTFGKSIILQNKNAQTSELEDSLLSVQIEAKGSLQYDETQGWKWHKSWILPDIKVTLNITSPTGQTCLPPQGTYIEIFQVKQTSLEEWESVGMRGTSKILATCGIAEFGKGLRLSQTSYGHQGARFYLVVGGYVEVEDKKKFFFSYASPSIFIDSRKSDREFKLQREMNFTELFSPDSIEKPLFKQVLSQDQLVIENSAEGFYNFITASNLRNKIKHPVYLAIKFSAVFQILCRGDQPTDKQLLRQLEKLQTNLVYRQNGIKNVEDSLILKITSFKNFKRNRKLNESLKHLSTLVTVLREDKFCLEELKEYSQIPPQQLQRVYNSNQSRLFTIMRMAKANVYNMQEKSAESQGHQSSGSEQIQPEEVVKKVKIEQQSEQTPEQIPQSPPGYNNQLNMLHVQNYMLQLGMLGQQMYFSPSFY